nr:hypothetical protein [Tanacetum cinerariifolium]
MRNSMCQPLLLVRHCLEQDSAKKVKTSEEVSEEDLKEMMHLVPVEEVYVEALQHFDREDLNQLWALVKETLRIRPTTCDKEKELWLSGDYMTLVVFIIYFQEIKKFSCIPTASDEFPLPEFISTAMKKGSPAEVVDPFFGNNIEHPTRRHTSCAGRQGVFYEKNFLSFENMKHKDVRVRSKMVNRMDTLSLVLKYLKDLEECMDDGDSKIAKEAKLFDALEYKSVVIEVDNIKIAIFTKVPLRAFGEPFMSNYSRKMVNDVNIEIHRVNFKADFVVLDYVNKEEPSIVLGRDFLQKVKMKEVLDIKYKKLEESKPIILVLEIYIIYKKKLDEILIGKESLNKKEFSREDKVGIIKHGLPKKIYDLENYVLQVKINAVVEMVALVDTRASAMGEVKNVRIQIGYQAYVVDLLILDISVDLELPLLLGRPFLRTYGVVIDIERDTLCNDDGVICHTYSPKPRTKSYVEAFEMEGEDDWLGSFEVGRDEDGNVKYGPVAPSFIDIEDDMERALAI